MNDSLQCWSNFRVEQLKIWSLSSFDRTRRFEIIHWFNHHHFFDPQHCFRRKLWASTYLNHESFLQTSKCCWVREFVKMKIRNVQSLLVCSIIVWKSSLTRDEWISGWRSWLASLILSWCLAFTLLRRWWANRFWQAWTPWIQFLRKRCCRRRRWICKNVSRYTMRVPNTWRLDIPRERLAFRQDLEKVGKHWLTGNVGLSTAYWFSISKISRIIHTSFFIL